MTLLFTVKYAVLRMGKNSSPLLLPPVEAFSEDSNMACHMRFILQQALAINFPLALRPELPGKKLLQVMVLHLVSFVDKYLINAINVQLPIDS